jgi:uncharacterized Zn finger protein
MSTSDAAGATPFERLREQYDTACSACGHEDADGRWEALTAGGRVEYRHRCPSCGAVDRRELRLR